MEYKTFKDRIVISLPITTPTGKVRVKRPIAGNAADPVFCRRVQIEAEDYLEWQIGYACDALPYLFPTDREAGQFRLC